MCFTGECKNNLGLFYQSFPKQAHCVYVWRIMLTSVPNIIFLTNFGALKEIKNQFTLKDQFFPQTQLIISSTQPAQQTDTHCHTYKHTAHSHTLLAIACTAQHPPTCPLHACQIISNPWPSPMPNHCTLFPGLLLLKVLVCWVTHSADIATFCREMVTSD